jgi:hypothetical protein
MSSTTTINDNLFQFDNLLTGLNYLLEEVQTRKEDAFKAEDIAAKIRERMDEVTYRRSLAQTITRDYGEGLFQEVAFLVMEKIDNDIEAFINARVDERLRSLGVIPAEG